MNHEFLERKLGVFKKSVYVHKGVDKVCFEDRLFIPFGKTYLNFPFQSEDFEEVYSDTLRILDSEECCLNHSGGTLTMLEKELSVHHYIKPVGFPPWYDLEWEARSRIEFCGDYLDVPLTFVFDSKDCESCANFTNPNDNCRKCGVLQKVYLNALEKIKQAKEDALTH